jgi:MerR family transcriptional regulator, light-induced transcriptional regulator
MTSSDAFQTAFEPESLDFGAAGSTAPAGTARRSGRGGDRRSHQLLRTIEGEIIPRLVLARRANGTAPAAAKPGSASAVLSPSTSAAPSALGWTPDSELIAEIANLVVREDVAAAATRIEALRQSGLTIETLYLELLAPIARYLGELWDNDIVDFTAVTLGCGRLQQLLHELSPSFFREAEQHEHRRRVLLVPVPGEQHTFGLYMVAEFFRRAGWDVWSGCMPNRELADLVGKQSFTLVGFSLSGDQRLDALASSIRSVRRASCNRGIGVLVGGPVFVGHPELVSLVGADATAQDGRQATQQAQNTLSLLSRAS